MNRTAVIKKICKSAFEAYCEGTDSRILNRALQRFRPLGRRILLRMDNQQNRVFGRIVLPDAHKTDESSGTVVKLGPRNELPIAIGDRVMTVSEGGTNVEIGGKVFKLCMPVDILVKL